MSNITSDELKYLEGGYNIARKWALLGIPEQWHLSIGNWFYFYVMAVNEEYGEGSVGTIDPQERLAVIAAFKATQNVNNPALFVQLTDEIAMVIAVALKSNPPDQPEWKKSLHPGHLDPFSNTLDPGPEAWERRTTNGEFIDVFLPAGPQEGSTWGDGGWTVTSRIDMTAAEDKTVRVFGHPDGTHILPQNYDASMSITTQKGSWDGRIWFFDMEIAGSPGNNINSGTYGKSFQDPLNDVRFIRNSMLDGPKPTTRPFSGNQGQYQFHDCVWNMPRSLEHAVYTRNSFGDCGMWGCIVEAVGGQVWQEVARPHEGPKYERGTTHIKDCRFWNYHQDFSRMGTALTFAGAGRDGEIERVFMYDLAEDSDRDYSAGALVVWNGGYDNHYDLESGSANGKYTVNDFIAVQRNGNRAPVSVQECESFTMTDSGVYSPRSMDVLEKCLNLEVSECNQDRHIEKAVQNGMFVGDLVTPQVRFPDSGQMKGPLSDFYWSGPVE